MLFCEGFKFAVLGPWSISLVRCFGVQVVARVSGFRVHGLLMQRLTGQAQAAAAQPESFKPDLSARIPKAQNPKPLLKKAGRRTELHINRTIAEV